MRRRFNPIILMPLAAALLAHAPGLWRGFVWDDALIRQDMAMRGRWRIFEPDLFGFFRPGKALIFSALDAAFGDWAAGWELAALAVLLAAVVLVYLLAREFLPAPAAAVAATIYAAHPLHVEATMWVSSLNAMAMTAAAMGYLIIMLRSVPRPGLAAHAAMIALLLAALAMREDAAVLPALAALMIGAKQGRLARATVAALLAHAALAVAWIAAGRWLISGANQALLPLPYAGWALALHAPATILQHFIFFAAPFRWAYYTDIAYPPGVFHALSAAGWIAALLAGAALMRRKSALASVPVAALLFAVVALLPLSSLVPMGQPLFGVRYLALAGAGLALAAGWAWNRAADRPGAGRVIASAIAGAWAIGAIGSSFLFHDAWRDNESFFQTMAVKSNAPQAWQELASLAFRRGDFERAVALAERAIAVQEERRAAIALEREQWGALARRDPPVTATPHVILGMALERMGRADSAVDAWGEGLRLEPDNADINLHLGLWHMRCFERLRTGEDLQLADEYFSRCRGSRAHNAETAWINWGLLWAGAGDETRAARIWEEGLRAFPQSGILRQNLETARSHLGGASPN